VIVLFEERIREAAISFLKLSEEKVIRIYSQYDADGISSAAIFSKFLIRLGRNFELRFFKQLNSKVLNNIDTNNKFLVFLDMGSGQLEILKDVIKDGNTLIIDHHEPSNFHLENLIHVNPHLFSDNIDPEDYCTSIIVYLFTLCIDRKNEDLIEYMIYGAIGDRKEESKVLRELIERYGSNRIIVEKGLKMYGRNKPLHKALAYNLELFLPGVFDNEFAAIEFLEELGIKVKNNIEWRTLESLSEEEIKKIVDRLVLYYQDPKEIIGDNFFIVNKDSYFSDVREVVSMINASSRLGFIDEAFRFCIGDKLINEKIVKNFEEYRKRLSKYFELIDEKGLLNKENSIFLFSDKEIPDSFIGVLVSMISAREKNKPVIGIGYDKEINMFKVSARNNSNKNINLRNILLTVVKEIGGEAGGHKDAAGAYIPVGKEKEFIERVDKLIGEWNGKG